MRILRHTLFAVTLGLLFMAFAEGLHLHERYPDLAVADIVLMLGHYVVGLLAVAVAGTVVSAVGE